MGVIKRLPGAGRPEDAISHLVEACACSTKPAGVIVLSFTEQTIDFHCFGDVNRSRAAFAGLLLIRAMTDAA